MADDKIKFSDIIEPDDSLNKLIGQLEEINSQYEKVVNAIRAGAKEVVHALKSVSGATSDGREAIEKAADSSSRLKRAQDELKFALSDTGKQVAWLKAQTTDVNRSTVEQQKYIRQAVSSYDKLKSQLKETVTLYKSLTAEERADAEMGKVLLDDIINLKNQIKALDDEMKPHIKTLSEVEKAQKKLAYLNSDEGKRLIALKAKIAELTRVRQQAKTIAEREAEVLQKKKDIEAGAYDNLKLYTTQMQEANRIHELTVRINNSAEGSYNRLSAQYSLNKIKLNQMGEATEAEIAAKRELEMQTKALYEQMIKLQEATGKHTLSVGNYKKAWNGLGMSVNQIIREIPAAAISLNTFFLGISNNVPILIDEIEKLRKVNAQLAAEGKPTKNVINEVVKSLFSWNTAIVVLLTVFAMFGKQIIEHIGLLIKGQKVVDNYKTSLQKLKLAKQDLLDVTTKANKDASKELTHLKLLRAQAENTALSTKQRKAAVDELQKQYPKYFKNISQEAILNGNAAESYKQLRKAILETAKAKAYEDKIAENEAKIIDLRTKKVNELTQAELKRREIVVLQQQLAQKGELLQTSPTKQLADDITALGQALSIAQDEFDTLSAKAKATQNNIDALTKSNKALATTASKLPIAGPSTKDLRTKTPNLRDTEDTIESLSLAANKAYQESITKLERESIANRRKEYLKAYNTEVADLNSKYAKIQRIIDGQDERYKALTEEQKIKALKAQEDIIKAIANKQEQLGQNLNILTYKAQEEDAKQQLESLNLQIAAVKSGSEEELRLRLQILNVEEQIALARNRQLPVSQQQDESAISAGFKKKKVETFTTYDTTAFEQQQALEAAKFNAVEQSERDITRFKLQQEKDRWIYQIALAKAGALDWSEEQITAAEYTVQGINRELKDLDDFILNVGKRGLGTTLLETLGFNDRQVSAIQDAANIVVNSFKDILAAEIELAEKEVELAEERVSRAQSAYDAEIEARNNGYAHNVATAKKELLEERRKQKEKEKILADAQKRQQTLDSLTQSSSLITASANLWKAFSEIPFIGPALAIAAIATMWTSFAAAKIKAKQVTARAQEYGEGGFEILEGGSHASGNDIDLGVNNKYNKRMKAEGGEALAIINKRQTKKYKKILPDVIDSFNRGTFEEKYSKAFATGEAINFALASNSIDLSKIEKDLSSIKKQNDTRYAVLPDGTIIMQCGNVKRIIKN